MTYKLFKWEPGWFEQADAFKRVAPDWETELQRAIVSKPEFVALTMGCKGDMVTKPPTVTGLTEAGNSIVRATYNKRWGIIDNNIPNGPAPSSNGRRSPHYCLLKEATQLVYDLGWQLPKPMIKLISPQIKQDRARSKKDPSSHPRWRKAFEFESDYLDAVYDLIEKNFIDDKGNPINDPKKWPLKKNLDSPVLKGRLLAAADSIITSGKRMGNRKK